MQLTAQALANYLKGDIEGNPDVVVSTAARIEQGRSGTLCFLANPKYEQFLYTTQASIVLLNRSFVLTGPISPTIIRVDDAYQAIAAVLDLYNSMQVFNRKGRSWRAHVSWRAKLGKAVWVGPSAYIGSKAVVGKNTKIFPHVYIGEGVKIGENCILYSGVRIYHGCTIGNNCIIHANAVIGSDGFGFAPTADGSYKKIPQMGHVIIEDDVEIGANTVIDRATMDATIIRKGVKLDNLIQVAHNVEIGENTVIAAQTGIAGSAQIGKNCMFAGQVGVAGHIVVADNVQVGAQCGVHTSFKKEGETLIGSPALNAKDYFRAYALFRHLPAIKKQIDDLEQKTAK
ncbi:MAG: UDP-3-O-(3-hydroxymyristoyl)glucosamine N-acyltransferase [Bacteroidales bacterium]|nr:UDP-3-O-(3-hydroxymyristoyl)glucosamine N-acyltransferase [Bacteroidales bacterium]